MLQPGDGLDPTRSVHNTRRDHCICEGCWGERFRTFVPAMSFTGGPERAVTSPCPTCQGTGKGLCRHRDDEPSNRERISHG